MDIYIINLEEVCISGVKVYVQYYKALWGVDSDDVCLICWL